MNTDNYIYDPSMPLSLLAPLVNTKEGIIACYGEYTLKSVYQPIYSFAHQSPIGYESLLRITDKQGNSISPDVFFKNSFNESELLELEELSITLHILNFCYEDTGQAWLFLNINPALVNRQHRLHHKILELINKYGISPSRVVIEYIEESITDHEFFYHATNILKQSGCLIAIDDFGAGLSNFDRIWDIKPDIVKLDKSLIKSLRKEPKFDMIIANLVNLVHSYESLVIMEGIETMDDAVSAHNANIDLHQGYFFCPPVNIHAIRNIKTDFQGMFNEIASLDNLTFRTSRVSERIIFLFNQAVMGTAHDIELKESCAELLAHPQVIQCYLLDDKGIQVSETVPSEYAYYNIDFR